VPGSVISPSREGPLGVFLIKDSGDELFYVNDHLISLGYAKISVDDADRGMKEWNPMEEEFHSVRNSYNVDVDDAGVAALGYKATDEQRVCRFYGTKSGCWRGDTCLFEHIKLAEHPITTDKKEVFCFADMELTQELPAINSWIYVQVTTISSPSDFHINFPYGTQPIHEIRARKNPVANETLRTSLVKLMEALQVHYARKVVSDSDLVLHAEGEIVMARLSCDESWHRAKVLAVDSSLDQIQVVCVDYGFCDTIGLERVRGMEPQFMQLPFQSVRCKLNMKTSCSSGEWSKEAREFFNSAVDGQVLIAHVMDSFGRLEMSVELYGKHGMNINDELCSRGFARFTFTGSGERLGTVPLDVTLGDHQVVYIPG
jgi:hypothetical protein